MAFTRLTPRWYIKRAMREIASFLAMTAGAGGYSNSKLLVFFPRDDGWSRRLLKLETSRIFLTLNLGLNKKGSDQGRNLVRTV